MCRFQKQRHVRSPPPAERERVPADVSRDAAERSATQRHVVERLRRAGGRERLHGRTLLRRHVRGDHRTPSGRRDGPVSGDRFRCCRHFLAELAELVVIRYGYNCDCDRRATPVRLLCDYHTMHGSRTAVGPQSSRSCSQYVRRCLQL